MATPIEVVFFKSHIPYRALRNEGFFGRNTKRDDFAAMIKRVCFFFGHKSIFEYGMTDKRKGYFVINGNGWAPLKTKSPFSKN